MAAELDTKAWQLNAWEINEWITFLEKKKYKDLFPYLRKKTATRSIYNKQHSGCWDLQLFCMILYYMYKKKNRDFMDYMYKTSNNNAQNKLALGTFITSIYDIIQDRKNYLYKYVIFKQFTDDVIGKNIINFSSIDELQGYTMYPMIIYTKPQGFRTYVILHYFTIVKSDEIYYILSSWGSDTLCVLPSIESIDIEEFSELSRLLSHFNSTTTEKRIKCMELVKKYFLVNAVLMYSDPNSVKKGLSVKPEEGRRLELQTFDDKQSYHIAFINKYNETIEEMIPKEIKKNKNNTRNTRNTHNTRNTRNTRNTHKNRNRSRSPHPRKN